MCSAFPNEIERQNLPDTKFVSKSYFLLAFEEFKFHWQDGRYEFQAVRFEHSSHDLDATNVAEDMDIGSWRSSKCNPRNSQLCTLWELDTAGPTLFRPFLQVQQLVLELHYRTNASGNPVQISPEDSKNIASYHQTLEPLLPHRITLRCKHCKTLL